MDLCDFQYINRFLKRIIRGNKTAEHEELHILKPGITSSPDGNKIAVAVKSGKSDAIIFFNLENDLSCNKNYGKK